MARLLVERIIELDDPNEKLDFDSIEQKIATLDVRRDGSWTPELLVDKAYEEANMKKRGSKHRITALGKTLDVEE